VAIAVNGQKGNLADVQPGMQVSIQMAQDRPVITRVDAITPGTATIKAIDLDKKTITVSVGGHECTAPVAADARISVRGKPHGQPGQLLDLSVGMWMFLQLRVVRDKLVITSITAQAE
jgi:hypothetical protein